MFFMMLVYVMLVVVRPQDYPQLVDSGVPMLQIALALALAMWLGGRRRPFDAPQYALVPALLLAMMFSEAANGWWGGVLLQLQQFGPVVVAFVLLAQAIDSQRRVKIVMVVLGLCTAVLAVHGIEQKQLGIGWTGVGLIQEDGRIQYLGIFNDPNDLGMLFVAVLPMTLYLSLGGGWFRLRRLFWLAISGAILWAIVLTDSRGTLLAVIAIFGVYLWRRKGMFTAGAAAAGCLGVLMMLPSRMQELDVSEESALGRVEAWYQGLQMFMSHPVAGVGAGLFADNNGNLTAHNSFVLVLGETGFLGFTIFLAFTCYCFFMPIEILRHEPELADEEAEEAWTETRQLATVMLLSLTGMYMAAFFLSRSYVILLYIVTALVVAQYLAAREAFPSLQSFPLGRDLGAWPVRSAFAIAGLFVVVKVLLVSV